MNVFIPILLLLWSQSGVCENGLPLPKEESLNPKTETNSNVPNKNVRIRDYKSCNYCLWVGAGGQYLIFQQKPPQDIAPIDYREMGFPSAWIEARGKIWKSLGARIEFQTHQGPDVKSQSLKLLSNKVSWTYTTVGLDYQLNKIFNFLSHSWRPRFLVALQSHSMPFLLKSGSDFTVSAFKFNSLSAGVYLDIYESKNLQFMWTNRLQLPMPSGGEIKVKSGLSFDGAIGAIYFLSRDLTVSGFWGGQYHSLNYTIDGSQGKYLLVTSKVSALLGIYF